MQKERQGKNETIIVPTLRLTFHPTQVKERPECGSRFLLMPALLPSHCGTLVPSLASLPSTSVTTFPTALI